jgi:hypothetical protein
MRSRNIKPGFYKNEYLAECSPFARLLFPGLWMMADREGRLAYRPKRIHAEIFPYDRVDIDALCEELEHAGMIERYEVGGARYMWILGFARNQNLSMQERGTASVLPPPPERAASNAHVQDECIINNVQVMNQDITDDKSISLNTEILNTEILNQNILCGVDDPAPDRPEEYTSEFEEFWETYPRHVAKKDAFSAWKARKRDKTLDAELVTQAARTYADAMRSLGKEGAYTLHAKTFLNKGRWREWLKPDGAAYLDAVKQYRDSENRKRGSPPPLSRDALERQSQRDRESEEFFKREQERLEREFGGDFHDDDGSGEASRRGDGGDRAEIRA